MDMAQVTGEQQARLQSEQNRKTAGSQLLGTGLNVLGNFAPEIIGALGNSPNATTNADKVYKPKDVNFDQ